jgi:drug/metabolite transporter (DMT)-like permease
MKRHFAYGFRHVAVTAPDPVHRHDQRCGAGHAQEGHVGSGAALWRPVSTVLGVVFQPWVFAGLTLFVVSMASHLVVLSRVQLSFAYPFLSLAYVLVAAYAFFVFGEDVGVLRMAGIAFIVFGTVLIAMS